MRLGRAAEYCLGGSMMLKIVVYTAAAEAHHVLRTIDSLYEEIPEIEILVLRHRPHKPINKLVRNQFRNLKRHGWRWLPYQFSEILSQVMQRRKQAAKPAPARRFRIETVTSVNSSEAVELVRNWRPDLGLSLAAPIIRACQFRLPRLGTLNIHKGKLPEYRGMPPAFWELWNGEKEVGITVHAVEEGLDTGPILLEDRVPIEPFSTPDGLRVRLDELGVRLMVEAVRRMRDGSADFRHQEGKGKTYSRPTLKQERILAKRLKAQSLQRRVKNSVFAGYGILGRFRPAYGDRAVVFLYHRVNDTYRDSVTIGVEQFETQIRYLADHYEVVSIEDMVAGRMAKDGPTVAISFDDGYLDNYENAMPILVKHKVPATFFVSTDHITRNHAFEHDLRKLGNGLPNMNWDQVREMHKLGLAFGSHTVNHINLARSDSGTVIEELRQSRATLVEELGLDEVMFAYPFGKRSDINARALELVKRAGYICNCSAYGGVNGPEIDRWDIRRQGIDHSFDIPALRAKIAGWKAYSYV